MAITPHLFEAFLKCPTRCWLRATGEPPSGNTYAEWVQTENESYRIEAAKRLMANTPTAECDPPPGSSRREEAHYSAENMKIAKWRLALDMPIRIELRSSRGDEAQTSPPEISQSLLTSAATIETCLHAVERIPSAGRGRLAQFVPIRFIYRNKLTKDDKLLLAFDAFVLSEMLGRTVSLGKIIRGDDHTTLKVKTPALAGEVRKRLGKITALLASPTPPDLVLNRHCAECEFQARCRKIALEKDDLSLLAGMSAKERERHRSKGIFTVTQLSYTFRPRRRPRRLRDKREKYHHSLKALAIRAQKIHIVGSPELKIEGTPVYLDVEGLPDRDFYYLIGVRIGHGDSAVQHSLWADTVADEGKIWREFLALLETVEQPVLIHYGSYETTFLKVMKERHGGIEDDSVMSKAIGSAINLISVMFGQIYFPTNSNSLKEIAGKLGFSWSGLNPSGAQTIVWRQKWERSQDTQSKQNLVTYNLEDCQALERVERVINAIRLTGKQPEDREGNPEIVNADDLKPDYPYRFGNKAFAISELEEINKAARWNYQRDRIYIRTDKVVRRAVHGTKAKPSRSLSINKESTWNGPLACPGCGRIGRKMGTASRILYDLRFSKRGIRTWVTRHDYAEHHCGHCHSMYGKPEVFCGKSMYGRNVVCTVAYMLIELCMPQRSISSGLNRMFGLGIHEREVHRLKGSASRFYELTRQKILARMVKGGLIHADETSIIIKRKRAYVWVFASLHEVVYFYAESREGAILDMSLNGFAGVLISDFYAVYDSVACEQQKCLIHLMRDLNDAVLDHPYDEDLRRIMTSFASLLTSIVLTIDRRGLKRHFLRKHLTDVGKFYRQLSRTACQSEAALKLKERFEKNRDKLFTFLNHDGVPWNNNNAEHAIKAFARLRRVIEGLSTPKGIEEYLILLSVCQTCKYMGVDFLDFLRSGEKDIHAFAESWRRRKRPSPTIPPTSLPPDAIPPSGGQP